MITNSSCGWFSTYLHLSISLLLLFISSSFFFMRVNRTNKLTALEKDSENKIHRHIFHSSVSICQWNISIYRYLILDVHMRSILLLLLLDQ